MCLRGITLRCRTTGRGRGGRFPEPCSPAKHGKIKTDSTEKMKDSKGTKKTSPEVDPIDDEDDEELTEQEKLMYQMIWGKVWDEEYPPEPKAKAKG